MGTSERVSRQRGGHAKRVACLGRRAPHHVLTSRSCGRHVWHALAVTRRITCGPVRGGGASDQQGRCGGSIATTTVYDRRGFDQLGVDSTADAGRIYPEPQSSPALACDGDQIRGISTTRNEKMGGPKAESAAGTYH